MQTDDKQWEINNATSTSPTRQGGGGGIWGRLLGLLVLAALAVGGYYLWQFIKPVAPADTKGATTQPARSIPVVTATAARGDLPIYLSGLGNVTAFNNVTLRTRVDGELLKVNFVEGQTVHEGEVLFEIDPRPFQVQLEQAEGQLARDTATLKNAQLDLIRFQSAREAVSQQQLDTAAATVAQDEGAIKTDQAQIDSAKLQLKYCHITSPLTGRIGLKMVDQGNMVHASDASGLAIITQFQPITVVFSLSQDRLPEIQKAMKLTKALNVDAFGRDMKTHLANGSLLALDNQIDPGTGMVRFKAVFDNKDEALYPSQFVNVRLLVDTRKNGVLVPPAAIQQSPQGSFVYVVSPQDSTVAIRPVTVGPSEGDATLIEQGTAAGDVVVTEGVDKLQPGVKVTVPRAVEATTQSTTQGKRSK
jgi:membrane fusion protein, multidrug efflux system